MEEFFTQMVWIFILIRRKHLSASASNGFSTACRWYMLTYARNRGELAEGWYEPAALQKAIGSAPKPSFSLASVRHRQSSLPHGGDKIDRLPGNESDEDDDAVGPALPTQSPRDGRNVSRLGPAIPGMQDLELKRGMLFRA